MMYQHFHHHIPWASCKREGEENEQNSFGAEISHDCRSHQIPKLHPSCQHLQSSAYLWHMSPGHDDKGNEHKGYDDASNWIEHSHQSTAFSHLSMKNRWIKQMIMSPWVQHNCQALKHLIISDDHLIKTFFATWGAFSTTVSTAWVNRTMQGCHQYR